MNRYFDICATTPIDKRVLDFMNTNNNIFGNPSSIHEFGQKSRTIIEKSRIKVSKSINSTTSEVVFTCNGSVSNNMALIGTLEKGDHLITSSYEHPAVSKVCNFLKTKGVDITFIKPKSSGIINLDDVNNAIKDNTKLISIMMVNNEIGSINPISDLSKMLEGKNILVHTDAVQAMGKVKIDVKNLGIDLLSLSGHKFYGPKGVGILYVKENTPLNPILFGGGQESDLFPGTENIVNIGAIGEAASICTETLNSDIEKTRNLEILFLDTLLKHKIDFKVNGDNRAPGILNITFQNTNSQSFIINLDMMGFAISAGSACSSGSIKGSKTLSEIGLSEYEMKSSYRISFSKNHCENDIKNFSSAIIECLERG